MTLDQIDQIVRRANPVPDLNALEPADASDLPLDRRRTAMDSDDQIRVDQAPQQPRRGLLLGVGVAALVVALVGALILLQRGDGAPVAESTVVTEPPTVVTEAAPEAGSAADIGALSYVPFPNTTPTGRLRCCPPKRSLPGTRATRACAKSSGSSSWKGSNTCRGDASKVRARHQVPR
jgi:hypothetical protein